MPRLTGWKALTLSLPAGSIAGRSRASGEWAEMAFVFVISREPRMRSLLTGYLADRGYETAIAEDYDLAMEQLPEITPDAMIVDVQGIPQDGSGSSFQVFNNWLAALYPRRAPAMLYLLRKGARRPAFRIDGIVIKKPFPIESISEALRERIGHPNGEDRAAGIALDMETNTLESRLGQVHLTNIEATLLAYLMQHRGETMHPRSLLMDVWQYRDSTGASTLVRAHVSNLRKKLKDVHGGAELIQTIRGKGYRFVA